MFLAGSVSTFLTFGSLLTFRANTNPFRVKYLPRSPRGESEGRELDIALILRHFKAGASDLELGASDLELGASGLAGLPLESHVMDIWGCNFKAPGREMAFRAPVLSNGVASLNVSEHGEISREALDFILLEMHVSCRFGEHIFDFRVPFDLSGKYESL